MPLINISDIIRASDSTYLVDNARVKKLNAYLLIYLLTSSRGLQLLRLRRSDPLRQICLGSVEVRYPLTHVFGLTVNNLGVRLRQTFNFPFLKMKCGGGHSTYFLCNTESGVTHEL